MHQQWKVLSAQRKKADVATPTEPGTERLGSAGPFEIEEKRDSPTEVLADLVQCQHVAIVPAKVTQINLSEEPTVGERSIVARHQVAICTAADVELETLEAERECFVEMTSGG